MMKLVFVAALMVVLVAVAVADTDSQAAASPECMLLKSSPNGYTAVARSTGKLGGGGAAAAQSRLSCSSSDNVACNQSCINAGHRGGSCCCSCGSVSLCNCYN